MAKVKGAQEKRGGHPDDAIKPEGWRPPDIEAAIRKHVLPAAIVHALANEIGRLGRFLSNRVDRGLAFPLVLVVDLAHPPVDEPNLV